MKFNLRMLANGFELSGQGPSHQSVIRRASLVRCSEMLGGHKLHKYGHTDPNCGVI
jgi:hypothetical protein